MSKETVERVAKRDLPQDRFDTLPKADRVGAHRISGRMRRAWRYVTVGLIATALLTTAGIIGLTILDSNVLGGAQHQEPAAPPEDKVEAVLDPTASVAVLNGSETLSLAAGVDQIITVNEWGKIAFSGDADASDVMISAVFYSDIADLPAAEGLAEKLGGVSTYQSDNYVDFGVRLVVLLGADYAGPGFEEAAAIAAQLAG